MSNNVCGSLIRSIHDRAVKLVQQLADNLNSFYNRLMYSAWLTTWAAVLLLCCVSIYKLVPIARVVYLIQHGCEYGKLLMNLSILLIYWRSNFENTSYITRENQSWSLSKSTFHAHEFFLVFSCIINKFHKIDNKRNFPASFMTSWTRSQQLPSRISRLMIADESS